LRLIDIYEEKYATESREKIIRRQQQQQQSVIMAHLFALIACVICKLDVYKNSAVSLSNTTM
jgi:hypothetical protein